MHDDLESRITEQRQEAERALQQAADTPSQYFRELYKSKARSHFTHMAGLISMRTDERVEEMVGDE